MLSGGLTSGVVGAGALLYVLTMWRAAMVITDMDVVNVSVGLQCEDEANQVGSRQ